MTGEQAEIRGVVVAVAKHCIHRFSKIVVPSIRILAGLGVEGDAHMGETVKHRSRVAVDPTQPNLRQVHLIHSELFDEVGRNGHAVRPADLGENITTKGIELLALPRGTTLKIGDTVVLELTGLRNPCAQIDTFQKGLLAQVLEKGDKGQLIRKSGVMTVVRTGGVVRPGDEIVAVLPPPPFQTLERV